MPESSSFEHEAFERLTDRESASAQSDRTLGQEYASEGINEEETLRRMKPSEQREFIDAEDMLSSALNPGSSNWTKQDPLFWSVSELGGALQSFQRYKDRLPRRCEAHFQEVLQNADKIKQILAQYPARRANSPDGLYKRGDESAIIEAHIELRRLDPGMFPRELVEITDKEFARALPKALEMPRSAKPWHPLMYHAKLAEYNPDAFRRIASRLYPPEIIQRNRLRWEQYPDHQPECREAWETLERALELGQASKN